jgi:Proline racemase
MGERLLETFGTATDRGRPGAVKRGHPDERFDASPRTLVALEVHAGGEPGRVIVEGVGHLPGATMVEKMCHHVAAAGERLSIAPAPFRKWSL